MAENRIARELETREKTARKRTWQRPEVLPSPNPEAGYDYHWVRISTQGQVDATNVSSKLREGWEPVKAVQIIQRLPWSPLKTNGLRTTW
jgi:hypothetical protein